MHLKDSRLFHQQCYIGGSWVDADNQETLSVTNPATGETLGSVPRLGLSKSIGRSRRPRTLSLVGGREPQKERSTLLRRWFNLMLEHQDDLAVLMTLEQGKPLTEARGENRVCGPFIEWFAEEAKAGLWRRHSPHQADKRIVVVKGTDCVCAAITPWNFPAAMITRKAGARWPLAAPW